MAMAVITPEHMYSVGLLSEIPTSEEADINFLMDKALSKVGKSVSKRILRRVQLIDFKIKHL